MAKNYIVKELINKMKERIPKGHKSSQLSDRYIIHGKRSSLSQIAWRSRIHL